MTATTTETGLERHGIEPAGEVLRNPTTSQLYTDALKRGDGRLAEGGPLVVDTGRFTGRSPEDKFVVREPRSEERIWWGEINRPIEESSFDGLRRKVADYLSAQERLYVIDAFAGADPAHRHRRAGRHGEPVPRALREDDVHPADRRRARRRTSRRRSCCTRPRSRPTPLSTERAREPSSCCTRRAARS